ncbi:C40 family peptidase [Kitasatospora sp. NBC_01250]|uniref:C40 family peptidase n=1 Tax=Kitasatospora sp. NBC_01250 TaxID=2903571 RepID=UPI002E36B4CD|nr:C40 family peptidase [Kitasatospora sp. NBC_01250]
MRIATDPALIRFDEQLGEVPAAVRCGCPPCTAASGSRELLRRSRAAARAGRIPQLGLTVRGACLATSVLAGAGVLGLGAAAGTASAEPAPSGPGWDGSKYWFKNAAGEWRYTRHYDVYLSRTGGGGSGGSGGGAGADADGMRQGWDGSVYWFKNAAGEWRYTSHYDVYLSRTGGGDGTGGPATPTGTPSTPASSTAGTEPAVAYALAQLGKPYVWGGNGPAGYDCSGLVQQAYRRAGIELPRVADDQYAATTPISSGQLRRGDLIFWSDSGRPSGIHHVAIYLGDGSYVEAPRPGKKVRVSTLNAGYYPTQMGRPS